MYAVDPVAILLHPVGVSSAANWKNAPAISTMEPAAIAAAALVVYSVIDKAWKPLRLLRMVIEVGTCDPAIYLSSSNIIEYV
jgi:hypothetical protein